MANEAGKASHCPYEAMLPPSFDRRPTTDDRRLITDDLVT
jgi:hypothetical protein